MKCPSLFQAMLLRNFFETYLYKFVGPLGHQQQRAKPRKHTFVLKPWVVRINKIPENCHFLLPWIWFWSVCFLLPSQLCGYQDEGMPGEGGVQPDVNRQLPQQRLQHHRLQNDQDLLHHRSVQWRPSAAACRRPQPGHSFRPRSVLGAPLSRDLTRDRVRVNSHAHIVPKLTSSLKSAQKGFFPPPQAY